MSAPDHGAEVSRADAAIRSLAHARASLLEASRAFGDIGVNEPEQGNAIGAQVRIAAILDRLDAMTARERGRRDAAELAARAARHPAGRGACPEDEPCGECARAYAEPDERDGEDTIQ